MVNSTDQKQESWFPIARKDIHKIRNAYVGAKADRLVWLWTILVSLANKFNRMTITIDLERIASKMGVSKRQTAKEALDCLVQIKMISVARPTRGKDGKYKPSVITIKPSVPCTNHRQSNIDNHVQNRNTQDRTVNNKEYPTDTSIVIKKDGGADGAFVGDSPGAHPYSASSPSPGTSTTHTAGAHIGGSRIEAMLNDMDTKAGGLR